MRTLNTATAGIDTIFANPDNIRNPEVRDFFPESCEIQMHEPPPPRALNATAEFQNELRLVKKEQQMQRETATRERLKELYAQTHS